MNLCTVFIEREKPVCICVCECVKHIQHSVFPVLIKRNYEMAPGKCQQILTLDSCHIFPTKKKTIKKKKKKFFVLAVSQEVKARLLFSVLKVPWQFSQLNIILALRDSRKQILPV